MSCICDISYVLRCVHEAIKERLARLYINSISTFPQYLIVLLAFSFTRPVGLESGLVGILFRMLFLSGT